MFYILRFIKRHSQYPRPCNLSCTRYSSRNRSDSKSHLCSPCTLVLIRQNGVQANEIKVQTHAEFLAPSISTVSALPLCNVWSWSYVQAIRTYRGGGTVPLILNLRPVWRSCSSFRPRPLYPSETVHYSH